MSSARDEAIAVALALHNMLNSNTSDRLCSSLAEPIASRLLEMLQVIVRESKDEPIVDDAAFDDGRREGLREAAVLVKVSIESAVSAGSDSPEPLRVLLQELERMAQ